MPDLTYNEWCQKNREIRAEARAIHRKKVSIYSAKQLLADRLAEARKEDSPRSEVYFVQESGAGFIKIGMSTNVEMRMCALLQGMPHNLTLLATMPGANRVESLVHAHFRHARVRGEWFRPLPELLEYISDVETGRYAECTVTPCLLELCREPATHRSPLDGPICTRHAEEQQKEYPLWEITPLSSNADSEPESLEDDLPDLLVSEAES
jgi:hypothetical protein